MKFTKKPVTIEATQWFKNGDHPLDYSKTHDGFENGEMRKFSPEERKDMGWEGDIVRYYRTPDVDGRTICKHCGGIMHDHGWIDTLEGGHIVCPGDWIITGVNGERYPCKPDIFAKTYNPAASRADVAIEAEIKAKGLTAPRVTPADIEANIASESYFTAADGVAGAFTNAQIAQGRGVYPDEIGRPKTELKLLTFCVLVLRNGFTVTGESACASPENFNAEIGRKIARANAVNKIWPLLGFALKEKLHHE